MTADMRAQALMPRRDELLARLPGKIAAARSLPVVDCELAVDDAITYTALEHTDPIATPADLESVFWTACEFRIRDALRGRSDTVRAGWQRASEDALSDLADSNDPASDAERAQERAVIEEFAATLKPREQRVLRCKYDPAEREPLSYHTIAQRLRITVAAARAADRSIERSIKRFAAVYTAGRLCPNRELEITALAAGAANRSQARLAKAHIGHCQHCHLTYAEQLRTIRSAAFQRKVASLLPVAESQDRGRPRGAWDAIADTLTRPFAHDTAATATQLASSGAGRGAGTIAILKIAGTCMASATAGLCANTFIAPVFDRDRPAKTAPKKAASRNAKGPVGRHDRLPTRAEQQLAPTPTPTPKASERRASSRRQGASSGRTQGGTGPTDHEDTLASPAPSNAAPGGASEFDPLYQPDGPPAPAPAPAAPGANEFF